MIDAFLSNMHGGELPTRISQLDNSPRPFINNTKQVAAELVAGEAGHTLFDFVDDASLALLKLQAQVT